MCRIGRCTLHDGHRGRGSPAGAGRHPSVQRRGRVDRVGRRRRLGGRDPRRKSRARAHRRPQSLALGSAGQAGVAGKADGEGRRREGQPRRRQGSGSDRTICRTDRSAPCTRSTTAASSSPANCPSSPPTSRLPCARRMCFSGRLDLGPGEVRVLRNEAMWNSKVKVLADKAGKSTFASTVYNRQTRQGAVLGALTADAASEITTSQQGGAVEFAMSAIYGDKKRNLQVAPARRSAPARSPSSCRGRSSTGLEAYGAAVKQYNDIKLYRPIPCGWCSWDCLGWSMQEKQVYDTIEVIRKLRLAEYGFNVMQIDDGWQRGWRCSGDWQFNATRFPHGIRPFAEQAPRAGRDAWGCGSGRSATKTPTARRDPAANSARRPRLDARGPPDPRQLPRVPGRQQEGQARRRLRSLPARVPEAPHRNPRSG